MYPVLDHCLRAKKNGQKGVKAIVLYPMNALAADQEKRFAGAIWKDPLLKGAGIRVGNYTGRYDPADPGKGKDGGTVKMGPDHGISNHEVQQENPPDILLTNYRMLDFLLMRPQDRGLWQHNGPDTLKYLVLDELHTYDGAQGADVACLIRRLKERLGISKGDLCVVGTSATLDDRDALRELEDDGTIDADETGKEKLAKFAETLFEESIGDDAVIGEDRLRVENIVKSELLDTSLPGPEDCVPRDDEDSFRYAERQSRLWGGPAFVPPENDGKEAFDDAVEQWELRLGEWLKGQVLFKTPAGDFPEGRARPGGPSAVDRPGGTTRRQGFRTAESLRRRRTGRSWSPPTVPWLRVPGRSGAKSRACWSPPRCSFGFGSCAAWGEWCRILPVFPGWTSPPRM